MKYRPLFHFLRYTTPTWYFNLRPAGKVCYFPDPEALSEEDRARLVTDAGYQSEAGRKADLSWQAWCKGIMADEGTAALNVGEEAFALADEYRFVRKYFHPLWSVYVLLFRLLSFHAPWKEIPAFFKSRKVKRVKVYDTHKNWTSALDSFDSSLLKSKPLVSLVIPTLNRYDYLNDALNDLEKQDYGNFEVIIVDQSEPFVPKFYDQFNLDIHLIRQEEKALWLARNTAIQHSKGEYIALYEDDVRIPETWLSNHLRCLDYFGADISAGVFFPDGQSLPANRNFFRWAEQFATGNACLKKNVFRQIGLFDRQFEKMRMGDGEFGLRAYLEGFKSVSNPLSWCMDIKAPSGGLRQMGSWDAFRPKSLFAPRPVPSVFYFTRKYFGIRAAIQNLLNNMPRSLVPYHQKRNKVVFMMYVPLILLLFPLLVLQAIRSWRLSSQMLQQGNKIEPLD